MPPCRAAGRSVAPFLQRLPSLSAAQKAAAVNLGIFPDNGQRYAYRVRPARRRRSVRTDRLAGIDALLRGRPAAAVASSQRQHAAHASQARLFAPTGLRQRTGRELPAEDLAAARQRSRTSRPCRPSSSG